MEKLQLEKSGLLEMSHEEMMEIEGGFWALAFWVIAGFLTGIGIFASRGGGGGSGGGNE
jgi:lactobin A/cerein 7B family class IIb bacteriocin